MAQSKRARPAFSPPRPGKKGKTSISKSKVDKSRNLPTKSRLVSPTPSASVTESEDDQDTLTHSPRDTSSEPEFMLAEVVQTDDGNKESIIPVRLLHRIMQEHWQDKDKTRLSTDAREIVGKYIEIFVREAIMRSTYERNDREGGGNDGWLEVDDLERIAPQLCMDF